MTKGEATRAALWSAAYCCAAGWMAARAIVAAARGDWFLAGCYIVLAALFWQRRGIVDAALYARLHEEARKRAGVE